MEQIINRCSTRKNIIDATLKIIGEEGFQNVTIRKIAKLADVNVAAINYHFGSKDVVINEALKYMTGKLKDSFKCLCDNNIVAETRLQNFIRNYADAALEYPDVFRNYINHSMFNYDLPSEYVDFIKKDGLLELKNTLREIGKNKQNDDIQLFMKCFQIISGIAFPVLLGKQMHELSGIEYGDCEIRYKYLDVLMKTIIDN
jgi:TetR/AcrR family transcriptional regulator, regulator of cefoperazone and chloramphenicol sensitivity